jgi:chemotaxis protein methyltransferase CheR
VYVRRALVDPDERSRLLGAVISQHTRYFRDAPQLLEVVAHLKRCGPGRRRVWSAGCSTGEEPLSLLALAEEHQLSIELVASDVSSEAVDATRSAVAARASTSRVRVVRHDLIQEAPPDRGFDVILCRNVLLYYEANAGRAALDRLRSALSAEGRVFLGATDLLAMGLGGSAAPARRNEGAPTAGAAASPPARAPAPARPLPAADVAALLAEAHAAIQARDLRRAEEVVRRAEALEPDRAETHYVRGIFHRKQGDGAAALISFRRAAFLDPGLWQAYVLLADEWRRAGHPARADAAEQEASRLLEARSDEVVDPLDMRIARSMVRLPISRP